METAGAERGEKGRQRDAKAIMRAVDMSFAACADATVVIFGREEAETRGRAYAQAFQPIRLLG